ncbi:MAG: nucleoside triphosphate pyrophosphohydrolase [Polyangia bacterium]
MPAQPVEPADRANAAPAPSPAPSVPASGSPALASPLLAQTGARLTELVEIMNRLLAPDGCPWDREQTLATLRPYLIEESYEVLEALDHGDPDAHRDELGDVLFQIVFQSALRAREGRFGIDDVCTSVARKMTVRHPHVFGDAQVKDSTDVVRNWGEIKKQELAQAGKKRRTLDGVPAALPSLLRAQRLGEKAADVGFDWPDVKGVRDKLDEEIGELDAAIAQAGEQPPGPLAEQARAAVEHELGDVLFTLTRLAAKLGFSPEDALRGAIARFTGRFTDMESRIEATGRSVRELSLDEMNEHWEAAKRATNPR